MYAVYSSLETDSPIMCLNQVIGVNREDLNEPYVDGALFGQELLELDGRGYKSICLHINCPGGNVVDGFNIVNAILQTKTPVDTFNSGICASMAAVIFMAGRKRIMADYSSLMIHNPFGGDDNKMLNTLRQSCITLLSSKSKISDKEIETMMNKETWLMPEECLEMGFCTEIQTTSESNKKGMPSASIRAMWQGAQTIQNKIYNLSNTPIMAETTNPGSVQARIGTSLIAAYLDLSVDANEGSVLQAVKNRVNTEILARTKKEEELDEMRAALAVSKKAFGEMEDKYNKLVKDVADEKAVAAATAKADSDARAAAETNTKKVEATSYLQPHVKTGRIKAEAVDQLVATAMVMGLDTIKALVENVPLTKTAASAQEAAKEVKNELKDGEIPCDAMHLMARVQANVRNQKKI